jgi:hypothetical protein
MVTFCIRLSWHSDGCPCGSSAILTRLTALRLCVDVYLMLLLALFISRSQRLEGDLRLFCISADINAEEREPAITLRYSSCSCACTQTQKLCYLVTRYRIQRKALIMI